MKKLINRLTKKPPIFNLSNVKQPKAMDNHPPRSDLSKLKGCTGIVPEGYKNCRIHFNVWIAGKTIEVEKAHSTMKLAVGQMVRIVGFHLNRPVVESIPL